VVRVAHSADWHLGLARHEPRPGARVEDARRILRRFVGMAVASRADAAVFAGDTFNSRYPTPRALDAFAEAAGALSDAGITTLLEDGNHDGKDGLGEDAVDTIGFLGKLGIPRLRVLTEFGTQLVETAGGPLQVTTLPYPHKRAYDHLYPELDQGQRTAKISEDLTELVRLEGERLDPRVPRLLVGHLTVLGAKVSSERLMGVDWDVALAPSVLRHWGYAALGHVHRQQRIQATGVAAAYAGSPMRIDFGEAGDPKGFLLAEFTHAMQATIQASPSGARALQTVIVSGPPEEWAIAEGAVDDGAIVQPVVEGSPTARDLERLSGWVRDRGAYLVLPARVDRPEADGGPRRAPEGDLDPRRLTREWIASNVPEADRDAAAEAALAIIEEVFG